MSATTPATTILSPSITDSLDFPAIAREDLAVCEAILRGETVRGVKLGDPGITQEWVETWRDNMRAMLAKHEAKHKSPESPAVELGYTGADGVFSLPDISIPD